MEWNYDDGGRGGDREDGLGDCVTRSIAIAAQLDYDEVYDRIVECVSNYNYAEDGLSYADHADACGYDLLSGPSYTGIPRDAYEDYLAELGFTWHRCGIGDDPLPMSGRLIVEMPGHLTAVIDGNVRDTWDCRGLPVEGYWIMDWIAT